MPNFIKIENEDGDFIISDLKGLANCFIAMTGDLEHIDPETHLTLKIVEMSQEEFDNLPEFQG